MSYEYWTEVAPPRYNKGCCSITYSFFWPAKKHHCIIRMCVVMLSAHEREWHFIRAKITSVVIKMRKLSAVVNNLISIRLKLACCAVSCVCLFLTDWRSYSGQSSQSVDGRTRWKLIAKVQITVTDLLLLADCQRTEMNAIICLICSL